MCTYIHSKAPTCTMLWIIPPHPIAHTPPSACHRLCITRSPSTLMVCRRLKIQILLYRPQQRTIPTSSESSQHCGSDSGLPLFSHHIESMSKGREDHLHLCGRKWCASFLFMETAWQDMAWQKYNRANLITTEDLTDTLHEYTPCYRYKIIKIIMIPNLEIPHDKHFSLQSKWFYKVDYIFISSKIPNYLIFWNVI